MDNKRLHVGHIVRSVAGRDTDQHFVVVEVVNDSFVLVADGGKRRLTNPKRKNVKHLVLIASAKEAIEQEPLHDNQIKRMLGSL